MELKDGSDNRGSEEDERVRISEEEPHPGLQHQETPLLLCQSRQGPIHISIFSLHIYIYTHTHIHSHKDVVYAYLNLFRVRIYFTSCGNAVLLYAVVWELLSFLA